MVSKSDILKVKESLDLVDYIERSGVVLTTRNNRDYKGLCPFHNEKTPSFVVSETSQTYRCYGCGVYGDILSYAMSVNHYDFIESVKTLAEQGNIQLDVADDSYTSSTNVLECIRASANFYVRNFRSLLRDNPEHKAVTTVKDRGLSVTGSIKYGYSPFNNSIVSYLKEQGFSDEVIEESGVCYKKDDGTLVARWKERLIFFIQNYSGKVVGFSTRKLRDDDTGGKYVNSKDSKVFKKSEVLYNFTNARATAVKLKEVYVVEGQFDVSAMVEAGRENVVASSGTAFTLSHANRLRTLVTEKGRIVFCFDGDAAGIKTARSVFENNPLIQSQSYAVRFKNGKDPCDYRLELGNEDFVHYLESSVQTLGEFVIENILFSHDDSDINQASQTYKECLSVISKCADSLTRKQLLQKVSVYLGIPLRKVEEDLESLPEKSDPKASNVVLEHVTHKDKEEEQDTSKKSLREAIDDSLQVELNARILALMLNNKKLVNSLPEDYETLLSPAFVSVVDEIRDMLLDKRVIPEQFSKSSLVSEVQSLTPDLFPQLTNFGDDSDQTLFTSIFDYLRKGKERVRSKKSFEKLEEMLVGVKHDDVDYLTQVLESFEE